MEWSCYLYFLACSIILSKAQGTDEGCITCAIGKFFEAGFEDWILPSAAAVLQFLVPDSSPAPNTIPKEPDKQWTNSNPRIGNELDIEIQTIVSPDDKKCDRNGDGPTSCAVTTTQIIWPLPGPCGDEAQARRILNEINRLAPKGRVRSFHNKCGTWFFTAPLLPSQIQQLMDENIGIKFIEPDVEMEDDDMEIPSKFGKRRSNKVRVHSRQLQVRANGMLDFILVERGAPEYKALVSTPPNHNNPERNFAYFYSAGDGATIYWIDRQFYMSNLDLMQYQMAGNRLMAEGVSQEWARPSRDHGGCMLSIIGGIDHGLLSRNMDRSEADRLHLKMVKVNPTISSFLSGIQAIITELELRIERDERVRTWTVIGTHLIIRNGQLGRMLQLEAAVLFQLLTVRYQAIVVVSIGSRGSIASQPVNVNVWPANIAQASGIPIIVAASALYYDRRSSIIASPRPPDDDDPPESESYPFIILNAPMQASCGYLDNDREIAGDSPAVAIVAALVADMLTRPKVRAKLFIDNPSEAPEEQMLAALRPVSAKIRDYLDSLAFYHGSSSSDNTDSTGIRCVWNGLDPLMRDISQYNAR